MRMVVLGGGESGIAAALLAKEKGFDVFVSDYGNIHQSRKDILNKEQIHFEENGHTIDILEASDVIVKSPGIANRLPIIQNLRNKNIEVIGEIEFAYRYCDAKIIAITGSNGKTTTTSLIYHLLKKANRSIAVGGNIGIPFAELVKCGQQSDWVVLELSSFQLEDIIRFKPNIAVQLNITADHLDRYEYDLDLYAKAKFKMHQNQEESDVFIYNEDDVHLKAEAIKATGKTYPISFKNAGELLLKEYKIEAQDLKIQGIHNQFNALIAAQVGTLIGLTKEEIKVGLSSFEAIEHRLEKVREIGGVQYINDSKATNIDAVFFALESMTRPTIWIVGGVDKGNEYSVLKTLVEEKVKAVIFLGIDNKALIAFFERMSVEYREAKSMSEAIEKAKGFAQSGDAILLSPACASFDLFDNYIDRGNQFKEIVKKIN